MLTLFTAIRLISPNVSTPLRSGQRWCGPSAPLLFVRCGMRRWQRFADAIEAQMFETSAKLGTNIDSAVLSLMREVLHHREFAAREKAEADNKQSARYSSRGLAPYGGVFGFAFACKPLTARERFLRPSKDVP